jgi:hypothetical protein
LTPLPELPFAGDGIRVTATGVIEVPDDVGGGATATFKLWFPDSTSSLVGSVEVAIPNAEAARRFFCEFLLTVRAVDFVHTEYDLQGNGMVMFGSSLSPPNYSIGPNSLTGLDYNGVVGDVNVEVVLSPNDNAGFTVEFDQCFVEILD